MIETINLIVGISFLIVLSAIDFATYNKKKGFIPSTFTTIFLVVTFIISSMLGSPGLTIELAVFGSLIALLFTDLDLWGGIADFKVFVACAMLFTSIQSFLIFSLALTILAVFVKSAVKFKIAKDINIPFIPLILIAFIVAGALG